MDEATISKEQADAGIALDGCAFIGCGPEAERCYRDLVLVGEYTPDDDTKLWRARKVDSVSGSFFDWRPMRCAAEARAFLVSRRVA